MNLSEIKAALPKYLLLNPGQPTKVGDQICTYELEWIGMHRMVAGHKLNPTRDVFRRPIPDEVLENQAFWVLYNRLATVAPASDELGVTFYISRNALREEILRITLLHADLNTRRFLTSLEARKAIPLLGGEQNIIKHLSAGDLYSKWLMEQIQ